MLIIRKKKEGFLMKKTIKKIIPIITVLCLLLTVIPFSVISAESSNPLGLKQEILDSSQMTTFSSEEDEIKFTLEKILDAKSKTEYAISNYDFSELLDYEGDNSNFRNLDFFEGYIKFQHDFRDALDLRIENLTTTYTYDEINVTNNTAEVKVRQKLNYNSVGASVGTSETNTFNFYMKKVDNIWKIKEFSSNDLYFQMYYPKTLQRSNFSFEQLTQEYITPQEETESNSLPNISNVVPTAINYGIDELNVYTYALEYALNYNSDFPTYSGVDCQNFASQCVWAGFGGGVTPPATISEYPLDNSGSYTWYCKKGSGVTNSWTSCRNFRNYLIGNTNANEYGLNGTVYNQMTSSALLSAKCGDIVYTNGGGHAMVITNAPFIQFGQTEARTIYTLYVSAHTNDVWNKQLALICGNNLSSCMFAHINYFKR